MITLTHPDSTVMDLPPDLQWSDEFDWQPVIQEQDYSLTGALLVQAGIKQNGRTITLVGGEDACWITRAQALHLRTWAALADAVFALNLHGLVFWVRFDHSKQPVEARELYRLANPGSGHFYTITLRFFEVSAP